MRNEKGSNAAVWTMLIGSLAVQVIELVSWIGSWLRFRGLDTLSSNVAAFASFAAIESR